MILERIDQVKIPQLAQRPNIRDLGASYLGDHVGGCQRALWYKTHNVLISNPASERLALGRVLGEKVREVYMTKIREGLSAERYRLCSPYGWSINVGDTTISPVKLDAMYMDGAFIVGVYIFSGSGYGFRTEVFGARTRPGGIKIDHLIQCFATFELCPLPLHRIEVIYVDRDRLDDVCYSVNESAIPKEDFESFISTAAADSLPTTSYEKTWDDPHEVARLYANKQMSKAKYETWRDSGIGGDWHCEYCPFLQQCLKDDSQ